MVDKTLDLLAGEVRIQVCGASVERFLNLCARNGIRLRRTRRVDFGELHATVPVRDFKRLRSLMGRTGCRVHILSRRGAPFVLHRLRRRYVLFGGLVGLVALFFALTQFIWVIEIHAQPGISTYQLRQVLCDAGAYAGVPIASVDETAIREYVRVQMQDTVDFVTVSRIGNVLTVEAFGGEERPKVLDDKAVTGVVASRDGQIVEMQVLGGHPLVETGDVVTTGQPLVSAVTPPTTEQGLGHIGHGAAKILAQTKRIETSVQPLTTTKKQYTSKTKTQFALVVGDFRINLYFGSGISVGEYDKAVSVHRLAFGKGTVFPVALVRQDYTYYDAAETQLDTEELRAQMEQDALARIQANMVDGTIDSWYSEAEERDGGLVVTVHATCTEDIAREVSEDGAVLPEKQTEEPPED